MPAALILPSRAPDQFKIGANARAGKPTQEPPDPASAPNPRSQAEGAPCTKVTTAGSPAIPYPGSASALTSANPAAQQTNSEHNVCGNRT